MPLSFINAYISQRLQAISLLFTDCALNEATMNGCTFVLSMENGHIWSGVLDFKAEGTKKKWQPWRT